MLRHFALMIGIACGAGLAAGKCVQAQSRYATSDNMSGYVHWIDLYDEDNTRIDPTADNPKPYSPSRTCGRCHDFQTIAHGWHFNAVEPDSRAGRPGAPWIWSDDRTGTHLPLSYRRWEGTYEPAQLGLSNWQMASKFGGYLPGGGPGTAESLKRPVAEIEGQGPAQDRADITGPLPVDCMLCHRNSGSGYSPFVWTEQIASENFAYAPTAAMNLAQITGSMSRIRELDPADESSLSRLPKVSYETSRFRQDGKVYFDLVRKPKSDACYYCHTNTSIDAVAGNRWLHDEDVHLRAGLECADCHRNGLDHQTVRGYEGEQHPAGSMVGAFSCQGCHLGSAQPGTLPGELPGRMGAPRPAHRGLPPVHFEKLSCTACHAGPMPETEVARQLNSIAHRLGEHVQRSGLEAPGIVAPVYLPTPTKRDGDEGGLEDNGSDTKYVPHRLFWPSYWGKLHDGHIEPLNPEQVYEIVRRPLRVRRNFGEEIAEVSLSLAQRRQLLGEERARVRDDQRTEEEKKIIAEAEAEARQVQINERMVAALEALEEGLQEEFPGFTAVFVSGGAAYSVEDGTLQMVAESELGDAAQPYAWPLGHNVRPKQHSLGISGCAECHHDESLFFAASVRPVPVLPGQQPEAMPVHRLQEVDIRRLEGWNQLFVGRATFKVIAWLTLGITTVVVLATLVGNIASFRSRPR